MALGFGFFIWMEVENASRFNSSSFTVSVDRGAGYPVKQGTDLCCVVPGTQQERIVRGYELLEGDGGEIVGLPAEGAEGNVD